MEGILKSLVNLNSAKTAQQTFNLSESKKIAEELSEVSQQLIDINDKFNLAIDDEIIESLIYQELALKAKFNYLLRIAKENNITYGGKYIDVKAASL